MKKKLVLLMLSICLTGCITYKQFITQDYICDYDFSIKENDRYFEIDKAADSILMISEVQLIDNDTLNSVIYKHPTYETITNKQTNKQTNIDKMLIYEDGKLIGSYFQYSKGSLNIGKETHYDQNGNITKIIDHRQADKYPICYKEALLIVEQKINKRDSITSIRRDEKILKNDTLYYWRVYVKEPDPANGFSLGKSWAYQINAKNGKLIKKLRVISNPG